MFDDALDPNFFAEMKLHPNQEVATRRIVLIGRHIPLGLDVKIVAVGDITRKGRVFKHQSSIGFHKASLLLCDTRVFCCERHPDWGLELDLTRLTTSFARGDPFARREARIIARRMQFFPKLIAMIRDKVFIKLGDADRKALCVLHL